MVDFLVKEIEEWKRARKHMKILLNQFKDPKLSEHIFVGKGDKVFANRGAEEFGFTVGKEYEIKGISPFGYLKMTNDNGVTE